MSRLLTLLIAAFSSSAFGQGTNQISLPETASKSSDSVFAESMIYNASDSLNHTAVRSYFTRESKRPRNLRLLRYGVGAELHNGEANGFNYRGNKGTGFAVARLTKKFFVDAAAGGNTVERRETGIKTQSVTVPVLAAGFWYYPINENYVTHLSLRTWQDFLYYEWLELGATSAMLSGKNVAAFSQLEISDAVAARAGSTITEVSDKNFQTSSFANVLYKFKPRSAVIGLGPSFSHVTFADQSLEYWSPAQWSWLGVLSEVSIPLTRSLSGEAKWSFGRARIKDSESKLFSSGEVRLKLAFTKNISANLAYMLTTSNNSAEKWNRSGVGASLTAGL